MRNKLLSALLALTLCLSLCPLPASAQNEGSAWELIDLAATNTSSFAITKNGDLYAWGGLTSQDGECRIEKIQTGVKSVAALDNFFRLPKDAGSYYFVRENGDLYGVGSNDMGEFGSGWQGDGYYYEPRYIMGNVRRVLCGGDLTAAITETGELWYWGRFYGDDRTIEKSADRPELLLTDVSDAALGFSVIAALKTNGTVWSLGYECTGPWNRDKDMEFHEDWRLRLEGCTDVAVSNSTCLALRADGSLWGWGANSYGVLGQPVETKLEGLSGYWNAFPEPVPVADGGIAAVDGSSNEVYFLKSDGTLWKLGRESGGNESVSPRRIYSAAPVDRFDAGCDYLLYTTVDGRMYGLGTNRDLTLGVDSLTWTGSPILAGLSTLPAPTAQSAPPPQQMAKRNTQTVYIDGSPRSFDMYMVDGTNYIRLRELALALKNTGAEFEVSWDGSINIYTNYRLRTSDAELRTPFDGDMPYEAVTAAINVDSEPVAMDAIALDNGQYTYIRLRDLGRALDFNVGWDPARGVYIQTDAHYTDDN